MLNRVKIVVLWLMYVASMLVHDILCRQEPYFGLPIPAYEKGQYVVQGGVPPAGWMWMSLLIYLIPMIMILLVLFVEKKWFKVANFVMSIILALTVLQHLYIHLVSPFTIVNIVNTFLLVFLEVASILMVLASYKWKNE